MEVPPDDEPPLDEPPEEKGQGLDLETVQSTARQNGVMERMIMDLEKYIVTEGEALSIAEKFFPGTSMIA